MEQIIEHAPAVLTGIVAVVHFLFAFSEFRNRNSAEFYGKFKIELAEGQKPEQLGRIVANAAAFNGLLACGLVVTLMRADALVLQIYLLSTVILAGLVGGVTLKPIVAVVQSGPAALALVAVLVKLFQTV